jgi:hypothetical protein
MAVVEGKNTRPEGQKVQAAARLEACGAALAGMDPGRITSLFTAMDRSNKLLGQQLLDSHTFHARTSAAAENCVWGVFFVPEVVVFFSGAQFLRLGTCHLY